MGYPSHDGEHPVGWFVKRLQSIKSIKELNKFGNQFEQHLLDHEDFREFEKRLVKWYMVRRNMLTGPRGAV